MNKIHKNKCDTPVVCCVMIGCEVVEWSGGGGEVGLDLAQRYAIFLCSLDVEI